jgi:protease I
MDTSGKHVAILVDNYFEQSEFEEPLQALRNAGALVTVIGASTKDLQALKHIHRGSTFIADMLLEDADPAAYHALVVPGGAMNADKLRMNETAQRWAHDFLYSGRPLAMICHAPWLLVSADLLDGRKLTSYYTIQDDISNAGGDWVDKVVVIDGNLITSRQPDDLPLFCDALITALNRMPPMPEEAPPFRPDG